MASSWNTGTLVDKAADVVKSSIPVVGGDAAIKAALSSASKSVQEGKSLFQAVVDEAADKLAQGAEVVADTKDPLTTIQDTAQAAGEFVYDLLPEGEDVLEDVKTTAQAITEGAQSVVEVGADLGKTAQTLWGLGTSTPAKLLAQDIVLFDAVKERSVIDETAFTEEELEFLKDIARRKGVGRVVEADYGRDIKDTSVRGGGSEDVLRSGPLSIADSLYNSLSEFNIVKDPETGEYFIEDQYDWNWYVDYNDPAGGVHPVTGRPRGVAYTPEQFEKKFNLMEELFNTLNSGASEFEKAHNLAFLLGSRDYVDNDRDTGRKVRINLGKLD